MMESTGTIQDHSLVRAAQAGDHAAFEKLVYVHAQAVLRLALSITGSHNVAQDIHQETFMKVYKRLDGFRFECTISTWIYRIVTNLCLDYLRRNRTRAEDSTTEVQLENLINQISEGRPVDNPEQQLLLRELRVQISRALRRLTPRERMVFELKHLHGMKLRTVSEILNCSEPATKTSLFRATKKLRTHLAAYTNCKRKHTSDQVLNRCASPQHAYLSTPSVETII
jgi:RNA polymerase sigma-70 factor (ECF subfamily)